MSLCVKDDGFGTNCMFSFSNHIIKMLLFPICLGIDFIQFAVGRAYVLVLFSQDQG